MEEVYLEKIENLLLRNVVKLSYNARKEELNITMADNKKFVVPRIQQIKSKITLTCNNFEVEIDKDYLPKHIIIDVEFQSPVTLSFRERAVSFWSFGAPLRMCIIQS